MADTNVQETKELQNEHTENTDENIIEMPTEKAETDKAVDEKENTVVEDATASDEKPKAEETDEKAEEKVAETSGYRDTVDDPFEDFSRDQWILSHIKDEDLMEYLRLEQERLILTQQAKEKREKRIFTLVELLISLIAIVAVTDLLKDNPTILLTILYITGIIGAFWISKNPKEKRNNNEKNSK